MAPLVFLMGVGPLARWKKAELPDLFTRLKWAFVVSLILAIGLPFLGGRWSPMVAFGLLLALWIVTTTVVNVRERIGGAQGGAMAGWRSSHGATGDAACAFGVAVFIVGVTMVKGYETERDVRMVPGESVSVGAYTFRFEGTSERVGRTTVRHAARSTSPRTASRSRSSTLRSGSTTRRACR